MSRDLKHWNRVSGRSSDLVERLPTQPKFEQLVVKALELKPGDGVLDLGCGTGAHLRAIRDAVGPEGHVLAVDYSPKMVARTRQRVAQHGWDNVNVLRGDATNLELTAGGFDAVLASWSLSATQDVPAAVNTAYTALRPGGRLFAPDLRLVPRGLTAPVTWLLGQIYRLVARWTGVDVLESVRARFGSAGLVNGDGEPLDVDEPPSWAPIVLVVAEKR